MNAEEARSLMKGISFPQSSIDIEGIKKNIEKDIFESASKNEFSINIAYSKDIESLRSYFTNQGFKFKVIFTEGWIENPISIQISWYPKQEQIVELEEFNGFKKGDAVYLKNHNRIDTIMTIKSNGKIYTISGYAKNGEYKKPSNKDRENCEKAKLISYLNGKEWEKFSLDSLREITELTKAFYPEDEGNSTLETDKEDYDD
jgi:hypothetical protein